ncbi:hypothetical protein [Agaribacterium sp. ZY112]|uniref:hypothetical protein n=1 Tax=Agaribacterium sp. ZY112 TaxID=3233574 RepID=UPI00352499DE
MEHNYPPNTLDIEASGFGSSSYPIEVGIAKHNGERYCALICPQSDWLHWSDTAEQLHGISRKALLERGKPACEVCLELNKFLNKDAVFSDALSHDQRWLQRLFESVSFSPSFQLRAIEHIMLEQQFKYWDRAKAELEISLNTERHRASSDALLIQQAYVLSHRAASKDAA